jgi:hypothetical protein
VSPRCRLAFGSALVLAVAFAVVPAGCKKPDLACSPNTIFLEVTLPPEAASADKLLVTVTVAGATPDIRPIVHTPGQASGSVEIAFTSYPAGKLVTLSLAAYDNGRPLATLARTIDTPPGCASVTLGPENIDLGGSDGGAPDRPRDARRDSEGDAVVADAPASDAPADRPPAPVDMLARDLRPVDVVLEIDASGCKVRGIESCYNGIDDDCNGLIDCMDPACMPTSQCVPDVAASGGVLGVVGTMACPADSEPVKVLGADAANPGCTGCTCVPVAPTCAGKVTVFNKQNCADPMATGDTFAVSSSDACSPRPYADPMVAGAQLDALALNQPPCTAGGMPVRAPARFKNPVRFCPVAKRGAGCSGGQICVPRAAPTQVGVCTLLDSRVMCPVGTVRTGGDLFATLQDDRACGACTCTDPAGGSCMNMQVQLGNIGDCGGPNAFAASPGGPRNCGNGGQDHLLIAPGMRMIGAPIAGKCTGRSELTGTAQLADPKTLCCTN